MDQQEKSSLEKPLFEDWIIEFFILKSELHYSWYVIYERATCEDVTIVHSRFTLEEAASRMLRHNPDGALYRLRNVITGEVIPREVFGE